MKIHSYNKLQSFSNFIWIIFIFQKAVSSTKCKDVYFEGIQGLVFIFKKNKKNLKYCSYCDLKSSNKVSFQGKRQFV